MATASSVLAAMDTRRPGLKPAKQHLLLFFVQGHHLADFDEPLFAEPLLAGDHGVTLDDTDTEPGDSRALVDEAGLDSIGYVLERYGALSPADLRTLVQASTPWQLARKSSDHPRIAWTWLTDWFRRPAETDDPDDERPNRAQTAAAAELWDQLETT